MGCGGRCRREVRAARVGLAADRWLSRRTPARLGGPAPRAAAVGCAVRGGIARVRRPRGRRAGAPGAPLLVERAGSTTRASRAIAAAVRLEARQAMAAQPELRPFWVPGGDASAAASGRVSVPTGTSAPRSASPSVMGSSRVTSAPVRGEDRVRPDLRDERQVAAVGRPCRRAGCAGRSSMPAGTLTSRRLSPTWTRAVVPAATSSRDTSSSASASAAADAAAPRRVRARAPGGRARGGVPAPGRPPNRSSDAQADPRSALPRRPPPLAAERPPRAGPRPRRPCRPRRTCGRSRRSRPGPPGRRSTRTGRRPGKPRRVHPRAERRPNPPELRPCRTAPRW